MPKIFFLKKRTISILRRYLKNFYFEKYGERRGKRIK